MSPFAVMIPSYSLCNLNILLNCSFVTGWLLSLTNDAKSIITVKEVKSCDKLPVIPFHGLRHTSATILIAGKQDVRTVSSRLGHAQASTTMNIYAHALKETDRKAADAMETMLAKKA